MINRRFIGLKHKFLILFITFSLIPISLIGIFSYTTLEKIFVRNVNDNKYQTLVNLKNSFDLSAEVFETCIEDLVSSETTQVYASLRKSTDDIAYFNNLLLVSSKMDTLISQRGDAVNSVMFLWFDGSIPMIRGNHSYINVYGDYTDHSILQHIPRDINRIRWMYVDFVEDKLPFFMLTKPIYGMNDKNPLGVAIINIYTSYINELFYMPSTNKNERLLVCNEDNIIIHDSKMQDVGENANDLIRIHEGKNGKLADVKGAEYYYLSTISGVNDWKIIMLNPKENVFREIKKSNALVIIAIVACIIFAMLTAVFIFTSMSRNISKVNLGMAEFKAGDLDARVSGMPNDEIGVLGNTFNQMAENIEKLIENIKIEQKNKKEVEIRFLQAQVTPHFLYNTLNSIKALSRLGRADDVSKMTTLLISLLRMASNSRDIISLIDEIEYVKNYINIMQYRYDKQFDIVIELESGIEDNVIPKFSLQPLIENSLIHGFSEDLTQENTIKIKAYAEGDIVNIVVSDNGVGFDAEAVARVNERIPENVKFCKIGMNNVDDRIKLLFGEKYGMKVESEIGAGTNIYLTVPRKDNLKNKD